MYSIAEDVFSLNRQTNETLGPDLGLKSPCSRPTGVVHYDAKMCSRCSNVFVAKVSLWDRRDGISRLQE